MKRNDRKKKTRREMDSLRLKEALTLLGIHCRSFYDVKDYAEKYGHPHPSDTRAWSQILVSALTGIHGIKRKKGADLSDGSDVKGANTWGAIDTPRFNGVIKAGTKSKKAGKLESLNDMPHLFLVLWDTTPDTEVERCRVWAVLPQRDKVFRRMCELWYSKRSKGEIVSDNFQLHPPRNKNSNVIRNTCGNLTYPLLFEAHRSENVFEAKVHSPSALTAGLCKKVRGA
jgi:hypothetical protein